MKILVVIGHPRRGSFNHAIANTTVEVLKGNGHDVIFRDLYEEKFDPVLHHEEIPKSAKIDPVIREHCDIVRDSDGIIVVHPNWWGQPPAIVKGWIDRVIRPGVAYEFEEGDSGDGIPLGLLKAECALVFNTSNTPDEREQDVFGDPLERIWKNCVFELCGVNRFYRRMFNIIVTSTSEEREMWLNEVVEIVNQYFP